MPKTTTTIAPKMDRREQLLNAYMFVVNNWAVDSSDVAAGIGVDKKVADSLLKSLERKALVSGERRSEDPVKIWQSMYDIENTDEDETRSSAQADFIAAFPVDKITGVMTERKGATGPRYTDEQISEGFHLRTRYAMSWKAIATQVGVKSPAYFAKVVQATAKEGAR